jgi:hypothetical protein
MLLVPLHTIRRMYLHLHDPAYTDRLAAFFESLGQTAHVSAPHHVELGADDDEVTPHALRIYLRAWKVLHPEIEAEVEVG